MNWHRIFHSFTQCLHFSEYGEWRWVYPRHGPYWHGKDWAYGYRVRMGRCCKCGQPARMDDVGDCFTTKGVEV